MAYAGIHRELHALEESGLVTSATTSRSKAAFAANENHPLAKELKRIIAYQPAQPPNEEVRAHLAAHGAPILAGRPSGGKSLEETLIAGLHVSRMDASVARGFPVFLLKRWKDVNWNTVRSSLRTDSTGKHVLGFFLEVTSHLSSEDQLRELASTFRDRRRGSGHFFFIGVRSKREEQMAESRTPDIARRWGWKMNMGLDAFADMYGKHASV